MPHYLTREGLERLKVELETLKNVKRREIIDRIQTAKELGDLSENAEYQDAKEEQSFIEGKIIELENLIHKAIIIEDNSMSKNIVSVGSTVIVRFEHDKSTKEYTIVGSNEANPNEGKISNESPFGRAFLGRKIGDNIQIQVPKGTVACTVIEITHK